eukprot:5275216-Pyramimonas_sp.AAC.1
MGRSSPAQMIQHSEDLRSELRTIMREKDPRCREAGNLRAAKHRFESFQKPLGRTVRLFPSILKLLVRVAVSRSDFQGKRAKEFLEWIAASPKHLLMTGMMADAADEAIILTRFCDSEAMDVAGMSSQIELFLVRCEALFGEKRQCLHVVGYAKTVLSMLQEPFVWVLSGRPFTLAAPS